MTYKAAIVGCGQIAGGFDIEIPTEWSFTHAGAFRLCPETKLVSVCDSDPGALERFKAKWGNVNAYTRLEDMLEKEHPHVVSLCTPTEDHPRSFRTLCLYDVPAIFCEKPLSYQLSECQEMVSLAKERVVAVNYFRRWNRTLEELKRKIAARTFGRLERIVAYYTKGYVHNAGHLIDLLLWFFGPIEEGRVSKVHWKNSDDAGLDFELQFPGESTAHFFHFQGLDYNFLEVDFIFSQGRVVLGQRGQEICDYRIVQEPHYKLFSILQEGTNRETDWKNCMQSAVEDIIGCLRRGGKPRCSLEEAISTAKVCDLLRTQIH